MRRGRGRRSRSAGGRLRGCWASAVLVAAASCGGGDGSPGERVGDEPLNPGAPTPPSLGLDPDRPGLVLVIRTEDCFSCELEQHARDFRTTQRRHGERVQMVTVVVTERPSEDRALVEDFFAGERVGVRVLGWTPREHRAAVGDAPLPSIYVTHRGRVVEVVDKRPTTIMRIMARGPMGLDDLVDELLEGGEEGDDTKADDDTKGDDDTVDHTKGDDDTVDHTEGDDITRFTDTISDNPGGIP